MDKEATIDDRFVAQCGRVSTTSLLCIGKKFAFFVKNRLAVISNLKGLKPSHF